MLVIVNNEITLHVPLKKKKNTFNLNNFLVVPCVIYSH